MKISRTGFIVICALLIAGLVIILLPAYYAAREDHVYLKCPRNLMQLYKGLHNYMTRFGNNRYYPPHQGEMLWLCLVGQCGDTKNHPPDYFKNAPLRGLSDLFVCQYSNNHSRPTDYRGPRQILSNDLPSDFPIGADKPANHKGAGGNILRFDGSVSFRTDEDYEAALKLVE